MVNFNCITGAPACGQPFCPCLCCPCCLGDSFCSASSGITVTHYDALIGKLAPFAIPLLVKLGPCFQPCYKCADATGVCCVPTDPKRPSANSVPLVIFASRTIKDIGAYKTAFAAYAEEAMKGAGVRACFSFVDSEKADTVLQLMWIDSAADLPDVPAELTALYTGTAETDTCQIWGAWDDAFKAKMEADSKCRYSWVKEVRGYLKQPTAANTKGFATGSPPMIWISQRKIKPGKIAQCGKNFQYGTDMMYYAAPAALGVAEYTADDVDDATWSLRVFNDYTMGFKARRRARSRRAPSAERRAPSAEPQHVRTRLCPRHGRGAPPPRAPCGRRTSRCPRAFSAAWPSTSSPRGCPASSPSGTTSPARNTSTPPSPPTRAISRTRRTTTSRAT